MQEKVKAVFETYPEKVRHHLFDLRQIVFETASETEGVGMISETLKWGEPAYLTTETRSGSTIRLAPVRDRADKVGIFFNCQTDLVSTFKQRFPDVFEYEGSRAVILDIDKPIPREEVSLCIQAALTYHVRKRRQPSRTRTIK